MDASDHWQVPGAVQCSRYVEFKTGPPGDPTPPTSTSSFWAGSHDIEANARLGRSGPKVEETFVQLPFE